MVSKPSKRRLFFIGVTMGIADLIPGISGGTIAFISGIYEQLLFSIKNLKLGSLKKIAFPFLLPLGAGMATSILLFSKCVYFLLMHYQQSLFGFFFGLILASTFICAKEAKIKKASHVLLFLSGAILSFSLTLLPSQLLFGSGVFGIVLAGILGAGAMLLPGISGSFVLQVIGVYPLVIYALAMPLHPGSFQLLLTLGIGIALGFMIFSRIISFTLAHFHQIALALLVGFMAGGLKVLWPFDTAHILLPTCLSIAGFSLVIFLEIKTKHLKNVRGIN